MASERREVALRGKDCDATARFCSFARAFCRQVVVERAFHCAEASDRLVSSQSAVCDFEKRDGGAGGQAFSEIRPRETRSRWKNISTCRRPAPRRTPPRAQSHAHQRTATPRHLVGVSDAHGRALSVPPCRSPPRPPRSCVAPRAMPIARRGVPPRRAAQLPAAARARFAVDPAASATAATAPDARFRLTSTRCGAGSMPTAWTSPRRASSWWTRASAAGSWGLVAAKDIAAGDARARRARVAVDDPASTTAAAERGAAGATRRVVRRGSGAGGGGGPLRAPVATSAGRTVRVATWARKTGMLRGASCRRGCRAPPGRAQPERPRAGVDGVLTQNVARTSVSTAILNLGRRRVRRRSAARACWGATLRGTPSRGGRRTWSARRTPPLALERALSAAAFGRLHRAHAPLATPTFCAERSLATPTPAPSTPEPRGAPKGLAASTRVRGGLVYSPTPIKLPREAPPGLLKTS